MECETLFGLSETQLMCPLWGKKTLRLGSLTARKQMPSDGRNPFPNPISPTLMRKQAQIIQTVVKSGRKARALKPI